MQNHLKDKNMKLTEQRLKQIILEELETMNEQDKNQPDVKTISEQISKIKTSSEYYQVMKELLNHELNETHKRKALMELKPLFLKKTEEGD